MSNRAACRCSNPRRADYPDKQGNQGNRRRPYQIRVIPFASRRPKPPAAFSTPQGIALRRRAMQGNGARRRAMCACVCVLLRACVCESSQNRAGPGVHLSQTSGVVMLSACTRMRVYVHARAPPPPPRHPPATAAIRAKLSSESGGGRPQTVLCPAFDPECHGAPVNAPVPACCCSFRRAGCAGNSGARPARCDLQLYRQGA